MKFLKTLLDKFTVQAVTDARGPDARTEELFRHLSQVQEQDHCLAAVRELLSRHLVTNIATAGSMQLDDVTKLRACERMEFARMFLLELEQERMNAQVWLKQQQDRQAAGG